MTRAHHLDDLVECWSSRVDAEAPTHGPVEILRDSRGIYGIGVPEHLDFEALALTCGVEHRQLCHHHRTPRALILRPDRFEVSKPGDAALQMIAGGFRYGPFEHCAEEALRKYIHYAALERAGLSWPPINPSSVPPPDLKWWSQDPAQQHRNRKIYHGLRCLSLTVMNRMICEVIDAAADQDAIRTARRFQFRYRESLYRAGAWSQRAQQFINVFPLAALCVYSNFNWTDCSYEPGHWTIVRDAETRARGVATQLIESGARLRDVAAALDIPTAFRHVKPRVAHLVNPRLIQHPELLHWLPETMPAQRIWLILTDYAHRRGDLDFAVWLARHLGEVTGSLNERGNQIADLLDWVHACRGSSSKLITRPFVTTMSLRTAKTLSGEWHEAVAHSQDADKGPLPEPWLPATTQGPFQIVPLTSAIDLFHEGAAMHHCVASYADRVRAGETYVYSIRREAKRKATVSIGRDPRGGFYVDQIRGPCNAAAPKPVVNVVRSWLASGASEIARARR
jgi:hypothetical protein